MEMSRLAAAAVMMATSLFLSSCSWDEVPSAASPYGCGQGEATPLKPAQVARVLRRYGFSAERTRNSSCSPFFLADAVSNLRDNPGTDENAVVDKEGFVECDFYSDRGGPPYSASVAIAAKKLVIRRKSGKIRYFLANSDCSFYFSDNQQEQAQRITAAMRDLERSLRNP
jgi:glutamine synthetase